jgi:predicted RNA-binding Zn ribbon-like protein
VSRVGPRAPGIVGLATRRSIADVVWVANTRHGPGGHWFARVTRDDGDHDHLRTPADAVRYLADHGVDVPSDPPTDADLAELAAIREMVRGLRDPAAGWTPEVLRILAAARFTLDESRDLAAIGGDRPWSAFIADLMPPLLEVVRLRDRLEICGNPVCRLVFIDGSRSGTRRWCDDAGCSNRDRVRRHRMAARDAASRGDAAATMLP